MILNRLGLNNLIEPITKDLEFQQQDPFLLYRNAKSKKKSIYGVWFYEKDECKRLGQKLNSYVQNILEEQTSPGAAVGGATTTVRDSGKTMMTGTMPASQVDIMQMLSKAQQEYDTGGKKSEPKPMIDNPNAAATKSSSLIRPRPLKMPDTDVTVQDENVTPGTGVISLDALFRTASLQQGTSTQKQASTSQPQPQMDSYFSDGRSIQRSISMAAPGNLEESVDVKQSEPTGMPTLLKHIMSTGSMLEDIERQHRTAQEETGPGPATLAPGIPDVTQPPPNHPAYRGVSPHSGQVRAARKSPMEDQMSAEPTVRHKERREKVETGKTKTKPPPVGAPGPVVPPPQILSGNLIPMFSGSIPSSQPQASSSVPSYSSAYKVSPESTAGSRLSPRGDADVGKIDPTPVTKSAPLLTPADLLQSSSTSSALQTSNTSFTQEKQASTSLSTLAAAAASLSTELLSPMAFITSTARKTPPVRHSQERPSSVYSEKLDHSQESETLPVAALTKEQLLQALQYLLKHDSSFITTIHEAYLKSLHELSGQKS